MRILFILEHFYPYIGGAEKLFFQLTTALAKRGHKVTVICTLHDPALPKKEVIQEVQIIRINCYNRYLFSFLAILPSLKYAKHHDLIHTSTYNAALPAFLAGKWHKKKTIITFHEVWGKLWVQLPFLSFWQKRLFYWYEKGILKLPFTQYVAVSKFTQLALIKEGIPKDKLKRIYNGLDYKSIPQNAHEAPANFTYTYFGRLGISKGLDLLLPATQQFSQQYPDSQLKFIIPKRPRAMYKRIQEQIKEWKLSAHVTILHELPREALFQNIQSSSCVIIPSYSEGFCFAAAEAVGLGVPIITSQKGALEEVVGGRHIPIQEMSVNAIYNALQKAYLGEWEISPVKYFPFSESVEQYVDLYQKIGKENR